jgi:crotonobetainyl-CoA:carnitine CoA-transferase CaiB-like acyl-CoA transferase
VLADWGADVIKIENPSGGDPYRGLVSAGIGASVGGVNVSMELANRGKRSLALDLKRPEGCALLLRLIATADVFLTNFLPSALERLGLEVDALQVINPRLIYARGHGFGVRGPDADRPAYDATAFWARGGVAETLAPGGLPEPLPQRGALGDRNAAAQLAFGVAAALFRRERTGRGSVVDVSLLASAMWMIASDVLAALNGTFRPSPPSGESRARSPNPLTANYRCADGRFIALNCLQPDRHWADVCRALGRPELAGDPRFADMEARAANGEACVHVLEEAFAERTLAEWSARFAGERFAWAPFQRVTELVRDPQVTANGYIASVEVDGSDSFRVPTGALQIDERPPAVRRAPELGQHSEELLLELGLGWDEIARLKQSGAVP